MEILELENTTTVIKKNIDKLNNKMEKILKKVSKLEEQ